MAHRGARPAKKINNLRWAGSQIFAFGAFSTGTVGATVLSAGVPRETIMRTRGQVLTAIDGASTPGTLTLISMGLVLVPEGLGSTVLWDPFADAEALWFWHHEAFLGYEEMVTDVIAVQESLGACVQVDSKAMRKANVDEEVQFVMTNTTVIGGGESVNTGATFRFLLGS